jgi:DNA invertase Pin-like site-specific DNA recombinase
LESRGCSGADRIVESAKHVFAEFETNLRRERQLEGIAKAKAAGVYKRRKPSAEIEKLRAEGLRPTEIAKRSRLSAHPFMGVWRQVRPLPRQLVEEAMAA